MIDIDTVSIVIASAGILVALVYYASVLRHQNKLRQTDLIMRLNSDWDSRELEKSYWTAMNLKFKDYDEYLKKYATWEKEEEGLWSPQVRAMSRIAGFFDIVGILLQRKLVDVDMVDQLFGYLIKQLWEKMTPIVEGRRKDHSLSPTFRRYFEYLYDEMKKRELPIAAKTA